MSYSIVIPARMASQRLPGKPLLKIAGRSLIEHVYRRACQAAADTIVIATDDPAIKEAALGFGAKVVMTSEAHQSGSDRIAECANILAWADDRVIVNLQGDEPLMPAACLDQVAALLDSDRSTDVASLYRPIRDASEAQNPNTVKVVTDPSGVALYFSRSLIPTPRRWGGTEAALNAGFSWKRHIGLYAYRAATLRLFSQTPATPLEKAEKLEQLRFLEWGKRIRLALAREEIPAGVDTQEDLDRVRNFMS